MQTGSNAKLQLGRRRLRNATKAAQSPRASACKRALTFAPTAH